MEHKKGEQMNDNVNHPKHYKGYTVEIECIDITRHMNFQLGNAFKYIWRAGLKGDKAQELEDYEKAYWYLEDYVRTEGPKPHYETISSLWELVKLRVPPAKEEILTFIILGRVQEAMYNLDRIIRFLQKLPEIHYREKQK